ncbi:MAG: energy transducer TonB [Pyrinomonadaceae bacterium]
MRTEMPLNVRRFSTSVLLVLVGFAVISLGQPVAPPVAAQPQFQTSGDVMRERISKAKAFIVVRNYNAAIYELENIRRETSDVAVQGVVNVLLMNSYLEQGDYKRAQDLLNDFYAAQKTTKPNASASYQAVAAQIVKGARNRVERYRALGLSVSDRGLPLEATNDLEKMRETLELVITQSKEIGQDKVKGRDAMLLLEEAGNSRGMLARDDYDARRWKDEVADAREQLTNSRSIVTSAVANEVVSDVTVSAPQTQNVRTDEKAPTDPPVVSPAGEIGKAPQLPNPISGIGNNNSTAPTVAATPVFIPSAAPAAKQEPQPLPANSTPTSETPTDTGPVNVGSLLAYATQQTQPVYPAAAKLVRASGVVRVDVTINEAGEVMLVQKATGPSMLQSAAKDAVKKWKFKPVIRAGQAVKANGYVSFNFSL